MTSMHYTDPQMTALYDQLNAELSIAETLLESLGLGVTAEVPCIGGKLRFGKRNSWALQWVGAQGEPDLLRNMSIRIRIAAVDVLPDLLTALLAARQEQDGRLLDAIEKGRVFNEGLRLL